MKHAQGPAEKGDFNLTRENIDSYQSMANNMDEEIRWTKTLLNLRYKLAHPEENADSLYTVDYLNRRLEKIMLQRPINNDTEKYILLSEELDHINKEIAIMRPIVFDPEEGQKPENHEKMSMLTDRWNELEEAKNEIYGSKYPNLKTNLPKIYYMILEGVDMGTVNSCFNKMKSVLCGNLSTEQAANRLMDESQAKYNLPKTIYDPIRNKGKTKKSD